MKTRILGALIGLAISFALPTYAQQKDLADPQTTQKILAGLKKTDEEARNNNDGAAYAAQYTRDGVYIGQEGPIIGRQTIQKYFTEVWKRWHPKDCMTKRDGNALHLIGAAGNELWATGEWSETGQDKNGEPLPIGGYFGVIYVRDGDDWKVRMLASMLTPDSVIRLNKGLAPQPAATQSPTASPSTQ